MGQKVNPHGLTCGRNQRLGFPLVCQGQAFGDTLVEDYNVRKFHEEELV